MLDSAVAFLNANNGTIQFLSLLLWAIYVYFTIQTFRQIKSQTELQSNALLYVECIDRGGILERESIRKDTKIISECNRWRTVIENNISEAIAEDRPLTLSLKNKGKSDIVSWKINFKIKISPRARLRELNIHGKEVSWSIESEKARDIIGINDEVLIHIMDIGNIPELKLSWKIEYKDSRRKSYADYYGDSIFHDINALT